MTKEKRSFLERLTGAKAEESFHQGRAMPVYSDEEEEISQPIAPITTNMETPMRHTQPAYSPQIQTDEPRPQMRQVSNSSDDPDGQLTIDMYQTENEIVIKSTIAGVKPEDLDVAINNDMITIRGERSNEEEISSDNFYYQECYWGSFSRSVVLPVDVIPDKSEASLKNGILTIRLPKADINRVKKIQVRGF
ncbi:MAG: Hsp20/alpha crystallin family protein [Candidatus Moraniibacteriota bacterium]|nr:MAG: Hsp20/alpha crystallin family protein [Candidatus Moranbacteria bacterium]